MAKDKKCIFCNGSGIRDDKTQCYWCKGKGRVSPDDDDIVCPYCGEMDVTDPSDLFDGADFEGTIETECDECGKEFEVQRSWSTSYETKKLDDREPNHDRKT